MPSFHDSFPDAKPEAHKACRFYDEHYSSIAQWQLEPGKKLILRGSQEGTCRFCGRSKPEVAFQQIAHAIPECIGNKSLSTNYECDECNALFGVGIETDFGNWSKAQRTMSCIRGKKGIPAHKGPNKSWRFEHKDGGFQVTQDHNPIAVVNEDTREIKLKLCADPYTPIAVLKAFTKMALSLMPEAELPNFEAALSWIRNPDHSVGLVNNFPVLYTFVPGVSPFDGINAILLRRLSDDLLVPYQTFVLTYGNEVFQTIVPCPERDIAISGKSIHFLRLPNPYDLGLKPIVPMSHERLDLSGRTVVKGEVVETTLGYTLN
ncbi:MAG: HNH endonuclease [Parvibaculaceae bacterium]|nr:HNH endonuclease [Parvibaculaceae bacterium]